MTKIKTVAIALIILLTGAGVSLAGSSSAGTGVAHSSESGNTTASGDGANDSGTMRGGAYGGSSTGR
jgi:hypothetical protein